MKTGYLGAFYSSNYHFRCVFWYTKISFPKNSEVCELLFNVELAPKTFHVNENSVYNVQLKITYLLLTALVY